MSKTILTENGDEILLFDTYKNAHEYLEDYAKKEGYNNYEIVEDNYEIDNGLLFIAYDEKGNEITHYPLVCYEN